MPFQEGKIIYSPGDGWIIARIVFEIPVSTHSSVNSCNISTVENFLGIGYQQHWPSILWIGMNVSLSLRIILKTRMKKEEVVLLYLLKFDMDLYVEKLHHEHPINYHSI